MGGFGALSWRQGWLWSGLMAGGAAAVYGYGRFVERHRLVVERVAIPIAGLPADLDGLKIVQLSDLHLHPHTQLAQIERAVALANAEAPDVVALTGDYILQRIGSMRALTPVLRQLRARLGVFAVLGNHDAIKGPRLTRAALAAAGIPLLVNAGVCLPVGAAALYVAGLDDGSWGWPDLDAALAEAPAGAPVVLLMHEPDFADMAAADGRVALQLSGHTHGGQVRLPGVGPLVLPKNGRKYHTGLYRVGSMWVYTTRGVGVNNMPVRLFCPPEVTVLTLKRL
ncbi:MAG: metallophosphoesterase [Anaerolineales bacterium]|nr:metallophosphoesterase [Anaerolineales bacterium]